MAYSSPSFVFQLRSRAWPRILFVLVILYAIWFTVVLAGEQQARTDDPGAWTGVRTAVWAWLGLALFVSTALYYLLLLVRREVSSKTYVLHPPAGEGQPASFLQASSGQAQTAEAQPSQGASPPR